MEEQNDAMEGYLPPEKVQALRDELSKLKKQIRDAYREENLANELRETAFDLSNTVLDPPYWLSEVDLDSSVHGIPTLFISDWHWGELVSGSEVSFRNEFNVEVARERSKLCFQRFIEVYTEHIQGAEYTGCVLAIGGDMVSGNIHDELSQTNEMEIMPTVIDVAENIISGINVILRTFGKVACFCVVGNHGRTSAKPRFKRKAVTSYDWLIYTICEKHFRDNVNVRFQIPESSDCLYNVYRTKYLLTHGDQLGRGGDGIIGMLGPVTRGDHRRRARQMGMNEAYDIMICGHWHQLAMLRSRIVNGSLKGYDEFAYGLGFPPEPPMQASWLTHPVLGLTVQVPIFCDIEKESPLTKEGNWVGWPMFENEQE